ncbi:MAG: ketoacyl-ACP synthase III [Planctomycetales bacterium]|nr:ketoacyl-ACP synthase III [Planctomycetales bacterium]
MPFAEIGPIAIHFPERAETNADLQTAFPEWDMPAIAEKTGIGSRYIAAPNETASDLAVAACEKLFREFGVQRESIDFVLFCTQTPDYPLPTTACLLQHRLGLRESCGALDFNLGCSGFVYGLAIADGLIRMGAARRILLITAETYSKYIDAQDRSLRTIFGDAAAATLVQASDQQSLTGFQFGTDGSGADTLLVADGGARAEQDAIKPRHRKRWKSRLYMDGPSLLSFTIVAVPRLIEKVLELAELTEPQIELYLLHQATRKMLEQLQMRLGLDDVSLPIMLENYGNTVSCTLPILISDLRRQGRIELGTQSLLIGFGVGWSWAGCAWKETWAK